MMQDRPTGRRHDGAAARFSAREWRSILVAALTLIPFILVRFLGLGAGSPFIVAAAIGVAIVAAAFCLTWATEGLQVLIAAPAALAVLALVEVAPEYAFEILLAYRQQIELAAASLTGANRLLLGLGWPLIVFIAYLSGRRRGQRIKEVRLNAGHAVTVAYLFAASLYPFVIVLKGTLSLVDSTVLVVVYGFYIYRGLRTPTQDADRGEPEVDETGVGATTKTLPPMQRGLAITAFFVAGAFVLLFGAEPFVDGLLATAGRLGVSEFVLIQWLAPFLSEFPESLTAFFWAATITQAALGLGSLMSSKLNQWTLLMAAIPVAYSLGAGHTAALVLTAQSRDEIFLTAAQSLFGTVLLLTLRLRLRDALLLLGLFAVQFAVPIERVHVALGWLYLGLSAVYAVAYRREILAAGVLGNLAPGRLLRGRSVRDAPPAT
jgi:cation:H+ antiporter